MNAQFYKVIIPLFLLFLSSGNSADTPQSMKSDGKPSKAAADRCSAKLKDLEDFAAQRKAGQKQTTRFSQDEINSYLALELSPQYHPCLKSLAVAMEENKLQAVAEIDFDRLGKTSTRVLPKIASFLFSGTHTMTAKGQLISRDGKANFRLNQARFDNQTLPNFLVEEIISAVGRKQNPPFDPLQPSTLFYDIEKVDVHSGYIIVYQ
jgi:hypothetical protein